MIQVMLIAGSIGCILLAILVILHNSTKLVNLLSAGIDLCLATWLLSILYFMQTDSMQTAFFSAKVYYVIAAIFVVLLTLFAFVFPKDDLPPKRIITLSIVSCSLIVALLLVFPNFIIDEIIISPGNNYIIVNKLSYIIYSLYFSAYLICGVVVLVRKYLSSNKKVKAQLITYLLGILSMAIPGLVTDLILPYFHNYSLIWVGPAMASFFLITMSYGIIKHGMFDVRLAAVRILAYILSLVSLSVVYYYLAFLVSLIFFRGNVGTSFSISPINIMLALLLAFIFQPIKIFFDKITNRLFYKDNYSSDDFFARINRVTTLTTDLVSLLRNSANEIARTIKLEQAYFVVVHKDNGLITAGTNHHSRLPNNDIARINEYLIDDSNPSVKQGFLSANIVSSEIRRLMVSHKTEIILPLVASECLVGYLCLGYKMSTKFTSRDIYVLKTIADELTIAIQNALAVQEIRDLNDSLQQRIANATRELRASNAQLQRLDKAKDEFVGMASHQLRTPLTTVKGYLSMVMEGDAGEITSEQYRLLDEAFMSSERMVNLINDFLNVSRIQTGKFIIDKHPTDLVKLIEQEIDRLKPTAVSRKLEFVFKKPSNFPIINLDESKIREVVMNFADNALYYSYEGAKIDVDLYIDEENQIIFKVRDTGIGVSADDQARLFTKFYRASNAKKQRPDGTGVGLFLAKKVICAHGGRIIFESVEGSGSTFGFSLPIE